MGAAEASPTVNWPCCVNRGSCDRPPDAAQTLARCLRELRRRRDIEENPRALPGSHRGGGATWPYRGGKHGLDGGGLVPAGRGQHDRRRVDQGGNGERDGFAGNVVDGLEALLVDLLGPGYL